MSRSNCGCFHDRRFTQVTSPTNFTWPTENGSQLTRRRYLRKWRKKAAYSAKENEGFQFIFKFHVISINHLSENGGRFHELIFIVNYSRGWLSLFIISVFLNSVFFFLQWYFSMIFLILRFNSHLSNFSDCSSAARGPSILFRHFLMHRAAVLRSFQLF